VYVYVICVCVCVCVCVCDLCMCISSSREDSSKVYLDTRGIFVPPMFTIVVTIRPTQEKHSTTLPHRLNPKSIEICI